MAKADAQGRFDVSPNGDPPGFVHVIDNAPIAFLERPGNTQRGTSDNARLRAIAQ